MKNIVLNVRERVKIFNESLSVMNKWFPTIQSRKRSRSDSFSSDRSNTLYSADRSVSATGISKMGAQSHVGANGFDVEQKSEERTKNSVPNKRTRTSMVDSRVGSIFLCRHAIIFSWFIFMNAALF